MSSIWRYYVMWRKRKYTMCCAVFVSFSIFFLYRKITTSSCDKSQSSYLYRKENVNYSDIWMQDIEIDLVLKYLDGVENYLEWGSGGSTLNFAKFAKKSAVSVEHNKEWCELMRKRIDDAKLNRIEYHCIPNTTAYGGEGNYPEFKDYVDKISSLRVKKWDFVFIDGRCRVCAAIKALSYISHDSIVVLHDSRRFFDEGSMYTPILKYYEVLDSIGGTKHRGVAIMRRKKSFGSLTGKHALVQSWLEDYAETYPYIRWNGRIENETHYV